MTEDSRSFFVALEEDLDAVDMFYGLWERRFRKTCNVLGGAIAAFTSPLQEPGRRESLLLVRTFLAWSSRLFTRLNRSKHEYRKNAAQWNELAALEEKLLPLADSCREKESTQVLEQVIELLHELGRLEVRA